MRRLAIAFALVAAALARAEDARVHRCIGAQGEIVFSDIPCANPIAPAGVAPTTIAPEPTATATCPATPVALRERIEAALARRDANAIAGVMRWDGIGGGAARERMREIAELAARPLLGIDLDEGDPEAASLVVRTGSSDAGTREEAFRVVADGGCYWLER